MLINATTTRAQRWTKVIGAVFALLKMPGIDLPLARAQLEYNGGYVQTHRQDYDSILHFTSQKSGARSLAETPPVYFPDHDFYYPSNQAPTGPVLRSYYYTGHKADRLVPSSVLSATGRMGRAMLIVHVPEQAALWVDGTRTRSTGQTRCFRSPPLQPGQKYHYRVQAAWIENGQLVSCARDVLIEAGRVENVYFSSK